MVTTVMKTWTECLTDLRAGTISGRKARPCVVPGDTHTSMCALLLTLPSAQRGAAAAVKLLESSEALKFLDAQTKRGGEGAR